VKEESISKEENGVGTLQWERKCVSRGGGFPNPTAGTKLFLLKKRKIGKTGVSYKGNKEGSIITMRKRRRRIRTVPDS